MRTFIIDQIITKAAGEGYDLVLNLGAGFDSRPYRMDLPHTLSWIDVDHEEVIRIKQRRLENVQPRVPLRFVCANLAEVVARQKVLNEVAEAYQKILVLSEGVMCYLLESSVREFATQLHAKPVIQTWVADFMSPVQLSYSQRAWTSKLVKAPFVFAVEHAGRYFHEFGWHEDRWYSVADAGCATNRAPWRVILGHAVHKILPKSSQQARQRLSGVACFSRRALDAKSIVPA